MANTEKQRERLISLLSELFQLNQPDLDFGFYRIMHAKADRVSSFLQNDLLKIIKEAFGESDGKRVEEARLAYEAAIKQAKDFGAPNPEETEPVKKAKAAYDAVKDAGNGEGEIYDHLYRFFERYYDNGDFMSRRYYARETDGKAAPYSVPYDGREVYLHWANRDQYYIKTSEYLTNFTFNLANSPELKGLFKQEERKVHFRILEAAEGEHGNVKTTDKTERYFIIHKDEPIKTEGDDLVIQFEYRQDSEKTGAAGKWQEKRIDEAEKAVLDALKKLKAAELFVAPLATMIGEKKDRTLLRRYLNQYTSRNTMDYFIHKDLGGFMRRELDFYIKNEIMRLDDIESADVPRVEFYLSKLKVLRKISHHLIDFVAQLEEFQKKLWLKKKFVVETNYCITLDRIPEKYYGEIASNERQREEWVKLFAIDELKGYKKPLTESFLKDNHFLVLDTAFFDEAFKAKLLAEIQNLDEHTDGLLIHSENFQALKLMKSKMQGSIDGVYIDPPYNTDATEIVYKNGYRDSSWLSLIADRAMATKDIISDKTIQCVTIDDFELTNLSAVLKQVFNGHDITPVVIEHNHRGRVKSNFAVCHEYGLWVIPSGKDAITRLDEVADDIRRNLRRTGNNSRREDSPSMFYGIEVDKNTLKIIGVTDALPLGEAIPEHNNPNTVMVWPLDSDGYHKNFYYSNKRVLIEAETGTVYAKVIKGEIQVHYYQEGKEKRRKSVWTGKELDASTYGTELLNEIFGQSPFSFPKSINAVKMCLESITFDKEACFLDYFAGSGTTGHATILMNRGDGGKRKFILAEMGDYFDVVTRPRIQKVIYSKEYKNGKPVSRDGISHCFKYIRLESYEDALNNLAFREEPARNQALTKHDDFRREYMLKYWLDFETKGSPSLLSVEQFADPTAYMLKIKKTGSDEYAEKAVDLVETFNWLIGLHVDHIDAPRIFAGKFKREEDPELPGDQTTRLILDGKLTEDSKGAWWFRKVEGRVCRTPGDKKNMDRVLVIWRKLTDDLEKDNLMLDEWFRKYRLSTQDTEFDVIYVNGSNNLPNLKRDDENWKVRLIEETFHQRMWDIEG